jgi:GNAT superfamily N-acetyltransferase
MSPKYNFRLAGPPDAEQLGIIGPAIYAESYGHMWGNTAPYAKRLASFGSSAVLDFMAQAGTATWLVESESHAVGFLTLVMGSPDPIQGRTDGAEIPRIYLLRPARGKGLAAKLLELADRHARGLGASHLWLDAMKEAPWAWRTYEKWGFSIVGETLFSEEVKPEFKPMLIMRRNY